ncbi:MAG: hypothetical protein GY923_15305 [Aestuariibacter sp.]|nr:hypothetical protein [Aestuariibacter sp.]
MAKYQFYYFSPSCGNSFEDKDLFYDGDCNDWGKQELAEMAAEYAWDNNDGWEWLSDGTQLVITDSNKYITTATISVEMEPTFYAHIEEQP